MALFKDIMHPSASRSSGHEMGNELLFLLISKLGILFRLSNIFPVRRVMLDHLDHPAA